MTSASRREIHSDTIRAQSGGVSGADRDNVSQRSETRQELPRETAPTQPKTSRRNRHDTLIETPKAGAANKVYRQKNTERHTGATKADTR